MSASGPSGPLVFFIWPKFSDTLAPMYIRTLVKSAYLKINFLISQPKHVVGTQKNRLSEKVLLSTQNIC